MDVAGFQDLLDRLGDDLAGWPDQARQDAESLLQTSDEARAALAEAQDLRRILSSRPVAAPSGLIDRIMQRVQSNASDQSPSPPQSETDRS
jgi:hypothetical protein